MVISDQVKSLYYNIDEKAYCNGRSLYTGVIKGQFYKSIFYLDNCIISEIIDGLIDIKIELAIYLEGVVDIKGGDIIINVNCSKNFSEVEEEALEKEGKGKVNRYKIKGGCTNKYNFIDITNLIVNEKGIRYATELNLYLENSVGYIKIASSESDKKPFIQIKGIVERKHRKICNIRCKHNDKCAIAVKQSEKAKSYGHYINNSGAVDNLNERMYIRWESTFICENIRLLKDNVTLLIKNKGRYLVNYMVNVNSEEYNVIKLLLDNKVVKGSKIESMNTKGSTNKQIIVEVEELNSQLNIIIEGKGDIRVDKGIAASILLYRI